MSEGVTDLVRAGLRNAVRVTVKVERVKSKEAQRTPSQYAEDVGVSFAHQENCLTVRWCSGPNYAS